jgi:hypothetical protein
MLKGKPEVNASGFLVAVAACKNPGWNIQPGFVVRGFNCVYMPTIS